MKELKMFREQFDKNKHKWFPEIQDFTDPMNHIRYEKDVSKLTHREWFFFHPSAYKLIYYGVPFLAFFNFCLIGLLVYFFNGSKILYIFCFILSILMLYDFVKKLYNYESIKDFTFYDLYMREYKDDEGKYIPINQIKK